MLLRLVRIREDCARAQQTLDAARDFAEPFQTPSGAIRVFVESVGPSLGMVPGPEPMVQRLQHALPRPVAQTSPERETEPSQEHAPVPSGSSREEPCPSHSTKDPGDLNSPVGMEVSTLKDPSTSGNTAEAIPSHGIRNSPGVFEPSRGGRGVN